MENSIINQILDNEKEFIFPIQGKSMMPLFRQKKDCVIITKENLENLKKYDIVLYQVSKKWILHRIINIKEDILIIRGDNTFKKEYVKKEEIQGKVNRFYRKDKIIDINKKSLRFYIKLWNFIYPLRYIFHLIKKLLRKLFIWKKK